MPFTLAHPIAVAPLWYASRRRLDLSALVVGAMVPDISYFVALQPRPNMGHSPLGILVQGIPAGLLLLLLFHGVMAYPLRALLTGAIAQRLPRPRSYPFWPAERLLLLAVSIALGALSHVVWDAFTHGHGWFVVRWSLLRHELWGLPLYKLLQYSGGLLGLLALGIWLGFILLRTQPRFPEAPPPLPIWARAVAWGSIAWVMVIFAIAALQRAASDALSVWVVQTVVGCVTGAFVGMLGYALAFWYWRGKVSR